MTRSRAFAAAPAALVLAAVVGSMSLTACGSGGGAIRAVDQPTVGVTTEAVTRDHTGEPGEPGEHGGADGTPSPSGSRPAPGTTASRSTTVDRPVTRRGQDVAKVAESLARRKIFDRTTADSGIFRTPTGNIACQMWVEDDGDHTVLCDIAEYRYTPPPRPTDCFGDWEQHVGLSRGQVSFGCGTDTSRGAPGEIVLPYGSTMTYDTLACASETEGVTCRDRATGRGFFLSRDAYRFFQ